MRKEAHSLGTVPGTARIGPPGHDLYSRVEVSRACAGGTTLAPSLLCSGYLSLPVLSDFEGMQGISCSCAADSGSLSWA